MIFSAKRFSVLFVCLLGMSLVFCSITPAGAAAGDKFKTPVVSLDNVEVAHYWGFWYYSKKVEPTKGKPTDAGAPLDLAFIFNITNPNNVPVKLENLKFTVAFENFELNTVNAYETMWIPPGKTNQYRVHAMFDVFTAFLSLGVTGGFELKEKGVSPWDQLETWWTGIQNFSFPIAVKNGTATFAVDGQSTIGTFSGVYPAPAGQKK